MIKELTMLRYAAIFFVIALAAFILGFVGNLIVGGSVLIAKISFFIFFALFIIAVVIEIMNRRKKK
jgi:uncharacterized membrane protein YtjA (UPF0391 family)